MPLTITNCLVARTLFPPPRPQPREVERQAPTDALWQARRRIELKGMDLEPEIGRQADPRPMQISVIDVVRGQHHEIERLLQQLEQGTDEKALAHRFEILAARWVTYTTLEERHLYPALHSHGGETASWLVEDGLDDHRLIGRLFESLHAERPRSQAWTDTVSKLTEDIRHHLLEEEAGLLSLAEEVLDDELLLQLGAEMLEG